VIWGGGRERGKKVGKGEKCGKGKYQESVEEAKGWKGE